MLELPPPRTRGRAAKEPTVVLVRELVPEDLELLATEKGVKAPELKRIRDVHHALARLLATGMPESHAAEATGYSLSRISILKADPTFIELLQFYREQGSIEVGDFTDRLVQTAKMAQEIIQDRMIDSPELFENDELRKLAVDFADRAGFAPNKAKNVTVNINLAGRLERARQRVKTLDLPSQTHPLSAVEDAVVVEEEPGRG